MLMHARLDGHVEGYVQDASSATVARGSLSLALQLPSTLVGSMPLLDVKTLLSRRSSLVSSGESVLVPQLLHGVLRPRIHRHPKPFNCVIEPRSVQTAGLKRAQSETPPSRW